MSWLNWPYNYIAALFTKSLIIGFLCVGEPLQLLLTPKFWVPPNKWWIFLWFSMVFPLKMTRTHHFRAMILGFPGHPAGSSHDATSPAQPEAAQGQPVRLLVIQADDYDWPAAGAFC